MSRIAAVIVTWPCGDDDEARLVEINAFLEPYNHLALARWGGVCHPQCGAAMGAVKWLDEADRPGRRRPRVSMRGHAAMTTRLDIRGKLDRY